MGPDQTHTQENPSPEIYKYEDSEGVTEYPEVAR